MPRLRPREARKETMRRTLGTLAAMTFLVLAISCATTSTKITESWVNPDFHGPLAYEKVFVLFVGPNQTTREAIEGAIAARLQQRGVTGVPAYLSVPDSVLRDVPRLKEQLAQIHVDAVIVTRFLGKSERTQYVATDPLYWGAYPTFWGYYNMVYPTVFAPGYYVTDTFYKAETRIYDLKSGKMIWGGMSRSMNPTDAQKTAQELAQSVREDLEAAGLVKAPAK
jgi:hypothetical protein